MDDFLVNPPGPGPEALPLRRMQELRDKIDESSKKNHITDSRQAEFVKVARGFESMFLHMLLKQMKSSMLDDKKNEDQAMSFGGSSLSGYVDLQFADYAAAQGGIGIAQMVYSSLTGGAKLPQLTQHRTSSPLPPMNNTSSVPTPLPGPPTADISGARPNFLDRVIDRLGAYEDYIAGAAQKFNVPAALIKGVITAESAGKAQAVSSAGAKGLMQLMDATAGDMGVSNSFDPRANIEGGTKYLSAMLRRFSGDRELALAAYNAGPGNVQKYGGVPPFKETQSYIRNVLRYTDMYDILDRTSVRNSPPKNAI